MLFVSISLSGQQDGYRVVIAGTDNGLGYVNIGIPARNIGTVTDETGLFDLDFGIIHENDSLRFSMIGYEPKTITLLQLMKSPSKTVYLSPKTYSLPELNIVYPRGKDIMLGIPVESTALKSGFYDNNLGSELGIKVNAKKRIKLKSINFNVGTCTYDSVKYRLNIYRLLHNSEWENILTRPIYISFTKEETSKPLSFDLSEYSLIIEGQIIVTLELFRDLGEGKLLFLTQFFTGITFHRKTKESTWTQSPGQVGMYLYGQAIR